MTGNSRAAVVIWVLGILAFTNAFNTLVPKNKELIYDYKSIVEAGTDLPVPFASQILLQGKLHLKSDDNATWVKLTDMKHHMYNGKMNGVDELQHVEFVEMPTEMDELMTPFRVIHNENGKAMGIITNKQEKEFTRNMKRALASVLQMDIKQMNMKNIEQPRTFMTREHTIYGPQMARYTVLPQSNKMVMVQKTYELTNEHMWSFSNTEPAMCDVKYNEPVMQNSQRQYMINVDGEPVVQFMTASGEIFYTPFEGKSESYYILANQTMKLVSQVSASKPWQIQNEDFEALMYHYMDVDGEHEPITDITNGRKHTNVEKMMPKVVKRLEQLIEYLKKDHLHMHTPDFMQGQIVGLVRNMLAEFTLNNLKKLNTMIKQSNPELRQVFYEMVPLVGTTATTLFIKHLLLNYENEDMTLMWITNMLNEMALNVKVPTRQLLSEMAEVIDWEKKVQANLHAEAVMAFGTLVHRNVLFEINHKHLMSMEDMMHMYMEENNEMLMRHENEVRKEIMDHHEKYVEKIVNKMRQSQYYGHHLTYLSALYNMRLPVVAKYMSQALEEQWWPNHYKTEIMWTMAPLMMEDSELAYKILWPYMINRNENVEVRIAAYYIMMETHPSVGRLANMFWFMQDEPCHELYNFHYTYMQNMAKSKNPCHQTLKDNSARFLSYMRPSAHGTSMFSIVDFSDAKYGFGMGMQMAIVQANDSLSMMISNKAHLLNRGYDDELVYIKIYGIEPISDVVKLNTNSEKNMLLTEDVVMKLYNSLKDNRDAHIVITRIKKDFAVTAAYLKLDELPDFKTFAKMFSLPQIFDTKNVEAKQISISYEKYMKLMMPTDSGFLAVRSLMIPLVEKHEITMRVDSKNDIVTMHMDYKNTQWMHGKHGLEFYNPIMDVYQRIQKVHAFDASYPVLMDVTFNMAQKSMKISMKKHQDEEKDHFGMRSHVSTRVYIANINEDVSESARHMHGSLEDHMVSNGDEFRHNYTIMNKEDMMTGTHWKVMVFDTENHITNGTWKNFMYDVMDMRTKHFQSPLDYLTLMSMNYYERILLQPTVGTHGILLRMDPVHDHNVKSMDLNMRWNYELKVGEYIYKPGMKLSNRMTYSLRSTEKTLKTWDVYTTWELNPGQTNSKLKMDFTRIIPGQKDYKVCLEGTKKMTDHDVSGKLTVVMSQSEDGKCSTDDAMVDITMTGVKSHEQESGHYMYGTCEYAMPYFMQRYNTLQCLAEYSTVRKYIYNIKLSNLPMEFKKYITNMWDEIKGSHMNYYTMIDEHNVPVKENSIRMEVMYPMSSDQVDVTVYTPQQMHQITGVSTRLYKFFGMYPDNVKYSPMFISWHQLGLMDHCEVTIDKDHVDMQFNEHMEEHNLSSDWTMYIGDVAEQPKQAVYMKKINDRQMAMKMVHESNTMEVVPQPGQMNEYIVTVNGKKMPEDQKEVIEDWVTYNHITSLDGSPVVLTMPHSGIHMEFFRNATEVNMIMPKVDHGWKGRCTEHN